MANVDTNSWDNSQMLTPLFLQPAAADAENEDVLAELTYEAKHMRQLLNAIYKRSGVVNETDFKVTVGTTPGTVNVAGGTAVVQSASIEQGVYIVESLGQVEGIVVPASVGLTQNTHRVIIQLVDKADNPDATDPTQYGWRIRIMGGTPSVPAQPSGTLTVGYLRRTGTGTITVDDSPRLTAAAGGGGPWHDFDTFYNSWESYGSTFAPPRYRRTNDGLVVLDGVLRAGNISSSGDSVCYLPVGYQPLHTILVNGQGRANGVLKAVRVQIEEDGALRFYTGDSDDEFVDGSDYVSLAGISFMASGY